MFDLPPDFTAPDLQSSAIIAFIQPTPTTSTPTPKTVEQPADKPKVAEIADGKRPLKFSFELTGSHTFSADFDGAPGNVSVTRAGAELGLGIPAGERGQVNVSLDWTQSFYNFDGATGFVGGFSEPWEDVFDIGLRVTYGHQFDEQWGMLIGGFVNSSGEEGADFSDTLTYGGLAAGSYKFSDRFSMSLGVVASTRLEDDARIFPFVGLDWKIDDRWRLTTMNKPGFYVLYSPSESWTLSLGARYQNSEFRLNDRDAAVNGVGRDTAVPVEFGVQYKPSKKISIGATAGVNVYQEFRLDDSSGNKIRELETDPAAFIGFSVKLNF